MKIKIIVFLLFLFITCTTTASAGQYDYVIPPEELWSCFDYAMEYSRTNPEWGMVLISDHPRFRGIGNSHFVNYQFDENNDLITYDGDGEFIKKYIGWQYDSDTFQFFHFYVDGEKPTRYFGYKMPNAEAVYNGY